MNALNHAKVLLQMALPGGGNTHAERMERFYRGQARAYDSFRERLLHGRRELFSRLTFPEGGVWVDLGGGTGSALEFAGKRIDALAKAYVVDLSPSLLSVARERIEHNAWSNVEAVEADATRFVPAEGAADVVTFSYALTMIPNWFGAIDHARRLLRPGGHIGVVDFYVSRKHPALGRTRHGRATRLFWPLWFSYDNVFLNPDHLPYLESRFEPVALLERYGRMPYMPALRSPHYVFVGRRDEDQNLPRKRRWLPFPACLSNAKNLGRAIPEEEPSLRSG